MEGGVLTGAGAKSRGKGALLPHTYSGVSLLLDFLTLGSVSPSSRLTGTGEEESRKDEQHRRWGREVSEKYVETCCLWTNLVCGVRVCRGAWDVTHFCRLPLGTREFQKVP